MNSCFQKKKNYGQYTLNYCINFVINSCLLASAFKIRRWHSEILRFKNCQPKQLANRYPLCVLMGGENCKRLGKILFVLQAWLNRKCENCFSMAIKKITSFLASCKTILP